MTHSYNEREVLALLQEESTQKRGFEMIVTQYSEQLYWQIRRMVLSHEDANDLLQNTFIKAWINIDYFRAEAKLSTWLYRIALNECLTFLNKQRAASTVSLDDPEADALQKLESDPYFSGDKAEMALQKALLALPEKQRMVFNLKYYQEMKYEEMSDIRLAVDISTDTSYCVVGSWCDRNAVAHVYTQFLTLFVDVGETVFYQFRIEVL